LGSWTSVARVVRGEVLKIKNAEFVESAIILGNSTFDVIRKHIIPNIIPIVFTMLILRVPVAILTESGLSFIGLGLQPPASSLGVLAEEGFRAISIYPRLIILPAIFISILVWSTNTVFGFVSSKIGRI
jgi:oligopeptide transport system permease protein